MNILWLILHYLIISLLVLYHIWPLRTPSRWLLCFLTYPYYFSVHFIFWHHEIFQTYHVLPTALALESVISSSSAGSFHWRVAFRNQNIGTWCACYFCGVIACSISQWKELGNMYIYVSFFRIWFLCLLFFAVISLIYLA